MKLATFKYVSFEDLPKWLALGWECLDLISPYSVLCIWPFEGEAITP